MASRVILLVSPLLLLFPASLRIAGYRTASMIFLLLVNGGVGALVRWHARQNGRDGDLWGMGGFFLPLVTPVVLALLPADPYSANAQFRAAAGPGRAVAAKGTFEERFPLLMQTLEGQSAETRAGMKARFEGVKTNFEFLLPTAPGALAGLLGEAAKRRFSVWTGNLGTMPLVYGAGLVRTGAEEEVEGWLASAGAPGQKLKVAFWGASGLLRLSEHHCEQATAAGA
jgi:hypothetical protein